VHEITTLEIADVLRPIWRAKPEVARKTYPAIRRVFDRARVVLRDEHDIAMTRNPAVWSDLKALGFEAPRQLSRGRHPSLPYDQAPDFMAELRKREAVTARGTIVRTFVRMRNSSALACSPASTAERSRSRTRSSSEWAKTRLSAARRFSMRSVRR
jgi:hypothetical protein